MTTFVDTSAVLALLDSSDDHHAAAWQVWDRLVRSDDDLVTSSFVLVESYALVQSRLGLDAVRTMHEDVLPLLHVHWVQSDAFSEAVAALFVADRRRLSLVDCVSFGLMRRLGARRAFALDAHFREQGFDTDL